MKTVGIIAEYNPFHKGHAYQLQQARLQTGADYVIIVMSGCFVQRGLPALVDKFARTQMALAGGADLVLELPVPYATGSAETFARGAVSLLDSLGCVDTLCFGSECGDLASLQTYAQLFEEEPENYRQLLRQFLKEGLNFPAARSRAAEEYLNYTQRILPCSPEDADCRHFPALLSQPNNTLGVEYCRALLHAHSPIRPFTILRESSGYHDPSMDAQFASASAIRSALIQDGCSEAVCKQLPDTSLAILQASLKENGLVSWEDFSSILFHRLLSLSQKELARFQDISEDLAARIENNKYRFTSVSDFADLLKTKELTHTRITRSLCHILLNLRQSDLVMLREQNFPSYLRVLGFRKDSAPLLSAIKQKGTSPLLVKAADASHILTPVQLSLFEKDVFAAHVYEAAKVCQNGTAFVHEYTRTPVIL
jgi:predicted nucleotidyltransferase